jgi:hypothetical protein
MVDSSFLWSLLPLYSGWNILSMDLAIPIFRVEHLFQWSLLLIHSGPKTDSEETAVSIFRAEDSFGGAYCFHLPGSRPLSGESVVSIFKDDYASTLKTQQVSYSETLKPVYQNTRHHIP